MAHRPEEPANLPFSALGEHNPDTRLVAFPLHPAHPSRAGKAVLEFHAALEPL